MNVGFENCEESEKSLKNSKVNGASLQCVTKKGGCRKWKFFSHTLDFASCVESFTQSLVF